MKENYFFAVSEKYENVIKNSIAKLISYGVPISKSIYFGENKGCSYYGRTHFRPTTKKCLGYEYYVTVNKFLTKDEDIYNTVVHELLHTVKGGMSHRGAWRKWADVVNKIGEFKIRVYGKASLEKGAYKNKKAFLLKDFDPLTMDIVYCPKCGNRFCLKKGLKKTLFGKSAYLCSKCRVHLQYE